MLDTATIRAQFPILKTQVHGKPLIYLDNAATTQKPLAVLDASRRYYETQNANVHRGSHYLSQLATEAHEQARETAAGFINAPETAELLFTSGCTMGINLAADTIAKSGMIRPGEEIILSAAEHHSNIVPWQMLCERTGAVLRVIPLTPGQTLDMEAYQNLLSPRTRIVAIGHVSNTLGTVNPVREITALARQNRPDTIVLVDGAQAVSHMKVDVQELGCDFYAFSGHKLYAPTGIGALWGKRELLEQLPPWMGGGEMIKEGTFEKTVYNDIPFKYEAGTPNIEGAVAMAAAMDYVSGLGLHNIAAHEQKLTDMAVEGLKAMPRLTVLAPDVPHSAVVSVLAEGIHHYDLGTLLDQMGIAVRTGHHCCQPLMCALGTTGTTRASFALYNTEEEVKTFLRSMNRALEMLS